MSPQAKVTDWLPESWIKKEINMRYEGAVYRPPSEAGSLIIQLTIGCARNTCTFCSMYKDKTFRVRPLNDVVEDLVAARKYYKDYPVKKIFLADGDALIVKTKDLLYIFEQIYSIFPEVEKVSMYGAPKDILIKSLEELTILRKAGLQMIYMGIESGDDQVLSDVKKGVSAAEMITAGNKLKEAGIIVSVTLISGLGGKKYLQEHAVHSAQVVNSINPHYLGFLTLMVDEGTPMYDIVEKGDMELLSPREVLEEMKLFLKNIDSPGTIFRSNHASNYISLSGTFNRDCDNLLAKIKEVEKNGTFKPDKYRGF